MLLLAACLNWFVVFGIIKKSLVLALVWSEIVIPPSGTVDVLEGREEDRIWLAHCEKETKRIPMKRIQSGTFFVEERLRSDNSKHNKNNRKAIEETKQRSC